MKTFKLKRIYQTEVELTVEADSFEEADKIVSESFGCMADCTKKVPNEILDYNFNPHMDDMGTPPDSWEEHDTYYQPEIYYDYGTNVGWALPSGLNSFDVFSTKEDCEDWMSENDYDSGTYTIHEYHDDDIEDYNIIW